jgi:putative DNA-invertase from lambdoid prophage Rac
MGEKPKRVGLYLRVSTMDQSTDLQRDELLRHCERQNWTVTKVYEDKASGSSSRNRKMFEQLMLDCQRRHLDVVLVWKLDRLFRSLSGVVETLGQLNKWGVEFCSLTDNFSVDTNSGRLMMHLISAFSEFEVGLIRERVKAGLLAAKARGVVLGRPTKVDGPMELEIKRLRQQNLSLRQIARRLGISKTSVLRVVQNPTDSEGGENA